MRQAVPGTKKKAASKQAIHRLDGLYCSHVINKSISVPQAGKLHAVSDLSAIEKQQRRNPLDAFICFGTDFLLIVIKLLPTSQVA